MLTQSELAKRRLGIGSSDIAKIVGESPYGGPHDVFRDKLGLSTQEDSEAALWGRMMEPLLGQRYTMETGAELTPGTIGHSHPTAKWAMASPDFLAPDRIVECKASFRTSSQWSLEEDGVPPQYLLQANWQAGVMGYERVDVAVFLAAFATFRIYQLRFDQEMFDACMHIAERFWCDHVLTGEPPPIDHTDAARKVLAWKYPPRAELVDASDEAEVWFAKRADAVERIKVAEKDKDLASNKLCELIGESGGGGIRNSDWYATWHPDKNGKRSLRVNEWAKGKRTAA